MDNREKVEVQALAQEKSRSERRYDIDWISFEQAYSHKDVDWHHLWFLGYLFMFSGSALPLFLYLKQEAGQRFTQ
jgi:hypothetical protein